ncbi:MAG: sigma-70 family RNA polymerase sigma factor [Oscillospiraceae bacterium]|nr:sigma-70 family RNA polymerase sigma factor [Oscillospiraceae bacterium]
MMDLQYSFSSEAENFLNELQPGQPLPAEALLTALSGEDAAALEEALDALAEKGIVPDVQDLPRYSADTQLAVRLRREAQLVKQGSLLKDLEENDPLRLYLEEIAALPTEAGEDAEQLFNASLNRVAELAFGYAGQGVLLLDLIQEGSMGLWQALQNHNGDNFEKFRDETVTRCLIKAIILQAHEAGVGQKMRQMLEDYRSADERLLAELGRNPTAEEIAEALHISPEEAETAGKMLENVRSLHRVKQPEPEQLSQEEDQAVEDTAYFQMRQRIAELLSGLEETDAQLLTLRYGLEGGRPLDANQTAQKLNLTPEEVNAREAEALKKLRQQ